MSENERINLLVDAYMHGEADEAQLRELLKIARTDHEAACRIATVIIIAARLHAEADVSFVAEIQALIEPRRAKSQFLPLVMDKTRAISSAKAHAFHSRPVQVKTRNAPRVTGRVTGRVSGPSSFWVHSSWAALAGMIVVVVAYITGWIFPPSRQGMPIARVNGETEAVVQHEGKTYRSNASADLYDGDVIQSGDERLSLTFLEDNTVIKLDSQSKIRLRTSETKKWVELLEGRADGVVTHQRAGHAIVMTTSDVEVHVIGTRLSVYKAENATGVDVYDGKVNMLRRRDATAIDIPAGFKVVDAPQTPAPLAIAKLDKVAEGLIAHWPFTGFGGGRGENLREAVHGGQVQIFGAPWNQDMDPSAFKFSGNGQYADYSNAPGLNFAAGDPFSYTGWFNTREPYGVLVSQRNLKDESADIDIGIGDVGAGTVPGRIMGLIRVDGAPLGMRANVTGNTVNDGAWHHFALIRESNGAIELYLDGTSQGRAGGSFSAGRISTTNRAFGSERFWSAINKPGYFMGQLKDIRVYDRALKSAEISSLLR